MKITFIIGGVRSGKSSFALNLANNYILFKKGVHGGDEISPTLRKAYIATAEALDDEMKARIEEHKRKRGDDWDTYEEPINIVSRIEEIRHKYDVILIDCLTLWLSNIIHSDFDVLYEIENLVNALRITHYALRIYVISNEVGLGIVPDNALSRKFRDMSGYLNQRVASIADEVYFVTAGIPIKIKSSNSSNSSKWFNVEQS